MLAKFNKLLYYEMIVNNNYLTFKDNQIKNLTTSLMRYGTTTRKTTLGSDEIKTDYINGI